MGSVYVRLSVMMFLQYAVWGVWAPILALYLGGLEDFRQDTGYKVNLVYMTMAIASMISPFIAGQLADRFFATEKYLAVSHLLGGLCLFYASQLTSFDGLFYAMLAHCLFYAPTLPLTNSISFAHLPNSERDFGRVRLWGTIGWIAISFLFSVWLGLPESWTKALGMIEPPSVGDCLYAGGALSLVMAMYCLTLPHTPPSPRAESPFAFLGAFKLAKDRSFAVLLVVAFLVSTELQFYYVLTPTFFGDESGLSLSQNELEGALNLEGEQGRNEATLLMRQLDINRNRKLSERELKEAGIRETELDVALRGLQNRSGDESALEAIEKQVKEAELPTEDRPAAIIAEYVRTAADEDQDQELTEEELKTFIDQIKPLQEKVGPALLVFEDADKNQPSLATEKGGVDLSDAWVPRIMLVGQIMEIIVLYLLAYALASLGFRWTITLGILAWSVRYALFALGEPQWLVIGSQALHGFGYGFFFVATMIYAERVAPKDVRASAQSLIMFVTFGAGMLISSIIAGQVADYFDFNWHYIFAVPVAITAVCALIFLIGFRDQTAETTETASENGENSQG